MIPQQHQSTCGTSPKSKKHRKKFTPVGPAGLWFEHQKNLKKQRKKGGGRGVEAATTPVDLLQEDEEEEDEHGHNTHNTSKEKDDDESTKAKKKKAAEFLSTTGMAWTAMQCLSRWCTPHMEFHPPNDTATAQRRATVVRHHTPDHVLLVDEVAQTVDHTGVWRLPQGRTLLVMVEHVVIHSWLLWTVTLKDETGATIRAWCDPSMIEEEETNYFTTTSSSCRGGRGQDEDKSSNVQQQNKTKNKVLQEGYVWALVNCAIVLKGENDEDDDGPCPTTVLPTNQSSSNHNPQPQQDQNAFSTLERMLLVGRHNIQTCWTPEHLNKIKDEDYVAWIEDRNQIQLQGEPMYKRTMAATSSVAVAYPHEVVTEEQVPAENDDEADNAFRIQPRIQSMHNRPSSSQTRLTGRPTTNSEAVAADAPGTQEIERETVATQKLPFPAQPTPYQKATTTEIRERNPANNRILRAESTQTTMNGQEGVATFQQGQPVTNVGETPHQPLDRSGIAVVTDNKSNLEMTEDKAGTESSQLCAKRLALLSQKGDSVAPPRTKEGKENKRTGSMTPQPRKKRKRKTPKKQTAARHSPLPCSSPLWGSSPLPRQYVPALRGNSQQWVDDGDNEGSWDESKGWDDSDDDNDDAAKEDKPKTHTNVVSGTSKTEPSSNCPSNPNESADDHDEMLSPPNKPPPTSRLLFSEQGLDEIGIAWSDDDEDSQD